MAVTKRPRHTKSDKTFVRELWRFLGRVPGHDARIAQQGKASRASTIPILPDVATGPGGTAGPITQAYDTLRNRLDQVFYQWTGEHLA